MKAIVLAFTLKEQDKEKILKAVEQVGKDYQNHICIHGFMPRKLLEVKLFGTEVIDAIEKAFPIVLNMHNGEKVLRAEMADAAYLLGAKIVVIGAVKYGVDEEMELYRNAGLIEENSGPIFYSIE